MPKTVRFNALLSAAFFALTLVVPGSVAAQTNSVSPLSINGFGETSFGVTPNYPSPWAGRGIANVDRFSINMLNPADTQTWISPP